MEMAVSNRIYDLMTQKGLSKAEFARSLGKRPCEITKWLSGQHNPLTHYMADGGIYLYVYKVNPL